MFHLAQEATRLEKGGLEVGRGRTAHLRHGLWYSTLMFRGPFLDLGEVVLEIAVADPQILGI